MSFGRGFEYMCMCECEVYSIRKTIFRHAKAITDVVVVVVVGQLIKHSESIPPPIPSHSSLTTKVVLEKLPARSALSLTFIWRVRNRCCAVLVVASSEWTFFFFLFVKALFVVVSRV